MSCCGDHSVRVSRMAVPVKSGCMLHYKKRFFGKDWREEYVVLYNDSTLTWSKDRDRSSSPEGGLVLKEAPELMACGQFTQRVPHRPELPTGYSKNQLLAFGSRGRDTVQWFLCKNERELVEWMTAISNTLPPPPQPPPPAPEVPPRDVGSPPPMYDNYQRQAPPSVTPHQQTGAYPMQGNAVAGYPAQPAYNSYFGGQVPQQQHTTIMVAPNNQRDTGGDFAVGLMVGGALGYGWGSGFGWGHGCGWGGGGGWGYGGPAFVSSGVHIENHYDVDNTYNNSTTVIQEPMTPLQDDTYDAFDGGDFDACADFVAF